MGPYRIIGRYASGQPRIDLGERATEVAAIRDAFDQWLQLHRDWPRPIVIVLDADGRLICDLQV